MSTPRGCDSMSAHGPMPRSAWIFPVLAVLFFAGATALGLTFTPSAAGLGFAVVLLFILFDTVFAVVMIVCNGLVGICILAGGLRYREQDVQVTGSSLYLSVLIVIATITLIMPNYTLTTPGPIYSAAQLGFVSVVTIILYGVFLYTQTIRHRNYFVSEATGLADKGMHTSNRTLVVSIVLLLVSLLAVVLL